MAWLARVFDGTYFASNVIAIYLADCSNDFADKDDATRLGNRRKSQILNVNEIQGQELMNIDKGEYRAWDFARQLETSVITFLGSTL